MGLLVKRMSCQFEFQLQIMKKTEIQEKTHTLPMILFLPVFFCENHLINLDLTIKFRTNKGKNPLVSNGGFCITCIYTLNINIFVTCSLDFFWHHAKFR